MLKIGITGGIGSGKSTVCGIFSSLGIPIYYADDEAKKLYDENETLKQAILIHFGDEVYPKGMFNKQAMSKIVFSDPAKLKLLNQLVHPIVQEHGQVWFVQQKGPYAIKEAALLIESSNYKQLDKLILVKSPIELRIKRLIHRDGLSPAEIQARIDRQISDEEKEKLVDFTILNDEEHLLIPQVLALHEQFLALAKK